MKLECMRKGKTVLQQLEDIRMCLQVAIRGRVHQWPWKLGRGLANCSGLRLLSCNLNSLFVSVVQEPAVQLTAATGQIWLQTYRFTKQVSLTCLAISNGSFSACVHVKIAAYTLPYSLNFRKITPSLCVEGPMGLPSPRNLYVYFVHPLKSCCFKHSVLGKPS